MSFRQDHEDEDADIGKEVVDDMAWEQVAQRRRMIHLIMEHAVGNADLHAVGNADLHAVGNADLHAVGDRRQSTFVAIAVCIVLCMCCYCLITWRVGSPRTLPTRETTTTPMPRLCAPGSRIPRGPGHAVIKSGGGPAYQGDDDDFISMPLPPAHM